MTGSGAALVTGVTTLQTGFSQVSAASGAGTNWHVCVTGTVKSVTLKSLAGAPSLEAEIYDGTGSVTAIFLGRRRICGIETGKSMVLRGRITEREGQSIIYNPRYELLPAHSPAA